MIDEWLNDRLLSGERVIWSGRAGQGLLFAPRDVVLVPFSLVWCGFAIFWMFMATSAPKAPIFFPLFGGAFVCAGLYFVAGRFIVDAWIRRGVYYAVTDRRILISREGPFRSFTAINLTQLPEVQLSDRAKGRGTIRFGQANSRWGGRGMGNWTPSLDPMPQFLNVDDARRVFDLIQQARK